MANVPISCTLTISQLRQRQETVLRQIRAEVQEVKELNNGYAFRFVAVDKQLDQLWQLINLERKCCPFLQFRLTIEPGNGPVWLEITGANEAKSFLQDNFELLN